MNIETWVKKNNVPVEKLLIAKVKKYKYASIWYNNSNSAINHYFKERAPLFIDILAITSPRTTVKRNVFNAIKTINDLNGIDNLTYGVTNKQTKLNLKRLLDHGAFNGAKVNSFSTSLNLIAGSVCVDVWILKAFNIKRRSPLKNDLTHITSIIKHIANKLNMNTYVVQACLWEYAKKELNTTIFKESYDFKHYLDLYLKQTKIDNYI